MAQVGGLIGHYGLQDWWIDTFTEQQRDFICRKFTPLGNSVGLAEGTTAFFTSQSAIGFLTDLASWFENVPHLPIALSMLEQAERLLAAESDVLDVHFLYGTLAKYYEKSPDPEIQAKAINAALNQINICQQALAAFQSKQSDKYAPGHQGFDILFDTYIAHEQFENAETVCRLALKTGWWDQVYFDRNMAEIAQERAWSAEDGEDE